MKYVVIALIGALAAYMSNKGIAVFNDGFRAIVPQYYDGQINRKELAAMSFAISFGLVIGFGIPTSIAASILLVHSVLLATDIIGVWFPETKMGTIACCIAGAAYGLLLVVGLDFVVRLFEMLPFNFLGDLGNVSMFVMVAFAIFPAVVVSRQFGFKKGAITGIITVLSYFLIKRFGTFTMGDTAINLSAEGTAMMIGVILMLLFAMQVKSDGEGSNTQLVSIF